MDKEYKFQTDLESGAVILEPTQRINLASGNIVRVWFTPKGQIMAIPKSSLSNGDVKLLKEDTVYGLGNIPGLHSEDGDTENETEQG